MIAKHLLQRLRRRAQAQELPQAVAEDTTRLGFAAKRLLDDPVLQLAFELVEDGLIEDWRHSPLGDESRRAELYRMNFALREVRAQLHALLGDANLLEAEQAAREADSERVV